MSINTAHANNGVLIHAGEYILLHSDNVSMDFNGQDNPLFKGSKQGRIYLTSHRMIFNNKKPGDSMQSFSAPFVAMSDLELEQPVFGANYIKGKVRAQQNGNFVGEVKFKLYFKAGGAIEYGQALRRAALTAQSNMRQGGYSDDPPPYTPSGAWHEVPPPAYQPPPGYYGWLPTHDAFSGPAPNSVFMSDNPPPYAGIGGPPPYTPAQPYGQPQQPYNNNPNNWNGFTAPQQQPTPGTGWAAAGGMPTDGYQPQPPPYGYGAPGYGPTSPTAGPGYGGYDGGASGPPPNAGGFGYQPQSPYNPNPQPQAYNPNPQPQGYNPNPQPQAYNPNPQQQAYNPNTQAQRDEPPSWNGFSLPPDEPRQPANAKEAEALASAQNTTENQRGGNRNSGDLPPSYHDLPPNYQESRKNQ